MPKSEINQIIEGLKKQPYQPLHTTEYELPSMPDQVDASYIVNIQSCYEVEAEDTAEVFSAGSDAPHWDERIDIRPVQLLQRGEHLLPEPLPASIPDSISETARSADYLHLIQEYIGCVPTPPDISSGLGKRQDKRDLGSLEKYALQILTLAVWESNLYSYDGICWNKLDEQGCTVLLRQVFRDCGSDNGVLLAGDYKKIFSLLLIEPGIQRKRGFHHARFCLNFRDGTYNLQTMEFRHHDPDDDFLYFINLDYQEVRNAEYGNVFESFVQQNLSEYNPNVRIQFLEVILLVLLHLDFKYFFVLTGPSNTGKSQFVRFIMELIGRDNVSTVSGIQDFANRFTTSSIVGKLLCACLDYPDAPLTPATVGTAKQLVGDDPMSVEAKYKGRITDYQEKPVLVFCGNYALRIPGIADETALLNRMVTVLFWNPVEEGRQVMKLYESLMEEAAYIVGEAIKLFPDLKRRGFVPTRVEALPPEFRPRESREKLAGVQIFVENYIVNEEGGTVLTEDAFRLYSELAEDGKVSPINIVDFSPMLAKEMRTHGHEPQKRVGPTQQRGYVDVVLESPPC